MIDWLDEFYASSETRQLLEESFAPLFAEYGAAVAAVAGAEVGVTPAVAPFIQAIASTYIGNYLSSSRAQLQELLSAPDPRAAIEGRLAEWAEKRPGKVAQEATVQTSNAVTQTVYKDAGVTRKKWNARGKSCPYCRRMNGKVVGIDRPFHKEGDSIEVPDSEISAKAKLNFTHEIGHPPQHQGCDCVIEADMASVVEPGKVSAAPMSEERFNEIVGPSGSQLHRSGDGRLAALSEANGFNGRPQVLSKQEIDRHVANGEREWFRGVGSTPTLEGSYANDFRTGDVYYGMGVHGNGIYAATGERGRVFNSLTRTEGPGLTSQELAKSFAGDGEVIRGTLRANARIIERRDAESLWRDAGGFSAGYDGPTEWAMAQGYDAVLVPGQSRTMVFGANRGEEFGDQLIILNRTAVRVQAENVT